MPLDDIKKTRIHKLESLKKRGINAFPARTTRTHTLGDVVVGFETLKTQGELTLAGRVRAVREHGGATFLTIEDGSGAFQVFLKQDILGAAYTLFLETIDVGDIIETKGTLFITKRGEKTLECQSWNILTKALAPLPEKWHGLQDVEERYRKRYLDLLMNKEVRALFAVRAKVVHAFRSFLAVEGFIEAETPMLQALPGGATARPFETHLHALDMDLYLRIAPELYLKRLIVGGFEKVYELGRNFRNEGMDRTHNPEFTMLELYIAYADYEFLMQFVERLFGAVLQDARGSSSVTSNGEAINFGITPWKRVEFGTLVNSALGEDYTKMSVADLKKALKKLGIKADAKILKQKGKMIDEVFKKVALPTIVQPTFIINHPMEISPLAKAREDDPEKVERFQLVAGGLELVNAFSELNDPTEQESRFKAQEKLKKSGDIEAQNYDKEFVEALEYGMPPTAGLGIGIDRLIMLLTNSSSLREVLLFPTMRPRILRTSVRSEFGSTPGVRPRSLGTKAGKGLGIAPVRAKKEVSAKKKPTKKTHREEKTTKK